MKMHKSILVIFLLPVFFFSCAQRVQMDRIYARVFLDRHTLQAAYGPGKQYAYVIEDNQVFALVQDVPEYWDSDTKMYYCPDLTESTIEQINLCNSIKSDISQPQPPDTVYPYTIRFIPLPDKDISIDWLTYSGRDGRVRDVFAFLKNEVIKEEYETTEIPEYVRMNSEIAKILFIPERYLVKK